jgi:hypothetical protein
MSYSRAVSPYASASISVSPVLHSDTEFPPLSSPLPLRKRRIIDNDDDDDVIHILSPPPPPTSLKRSKLPANPKVLSQNTQRDSSLIGWLNSSSTSSKSFIILPSFILTSSSSLRFYFS